MLRRIVTDWPVWSTPPGGLATEEPSGDDWILLDEGAVRRHFEDDPARMRTFREFLRQGHIGIFLPDPSTSGPGWVAYGWLATPSSGPPFHLPRSARGRWWIFYCRTQESHRGQGHYRRAIIRLVEEAERRSGEPEVFVDTRADNAPARHAIERLGFVARGVVTLVRVPRTRLTFSRWSRSRAHLP